jgi:hypothetical protein
MALGPLVELAVEAVQVRLAHPGGPTARISVLSFFYLKTEVDPASET